uniref:Piezo n=1 Tax=Platynereis dumerilii TaxID=6359 RepID=A0A8G1GKW6_PLADU|nr:piezo [Platynereis dumerilii]
MAIVAKVLFRGLLPIVLFGATIVRLNGISLTYGLLLLISALLSSPSTESMAGHTGRYLVSVVVFSTLALLAQVVFQGYMLARSSGNGTYGQLLPPCSTLESSLRQIGLQRLEPNDIMNIIRIIVPDIAMFVVSIVVLVGCRMLIPRHQDTLIGQENVPPRRISKRRSQFIRLFGEFCVVFFLALSGVAYPSILSAVYFLTFLVVATWWACYKTFGLKFAYVRIALLFYSGAHLVLLYLYQFQFFQEALKPDDLLARLFGLTGVIKTECPGNAPWVLSFWKTVRAPMILSPAAILSLYFSLALETRRWRRKREEAHENNAAPAGATSARSTPGGTRRPRMRPRGSVTSERQVLNPGGEESLVDEQEDQANYDSMATAGDSSASVRRRAQRQSSVMSESEALGPKQRTAFQSILAYFMNQSYAAALIVMMVWSITYHSWLTFVYLLSACVIWMTPQKRQVALVGSPIIVFYAESLLIIQYIYGLALKDEELPTETSSGYNFKEIGLMRYKYPCIPLAIQCAYTGVFWLTLRQYMRELHLKRQNPSQGDLPLESVRDPAIHSSSRLHRMRTTDVVEGTDGETIKAIGTWIWLLMCKYWILVCASLFLVMAVQEAVIYRIIYMVLFLYFVLTFKLLYNFWRFSIVAFWWFVIVYSMVVLCLIYTYQFDNFKDYWKNGTGLSDEMLADIGLEKFDTATLFVKLLTPTSFLVVIILQLHYFQKPFLKLSDIKRFSIRELSINDYLEQLEGDGDQGGVSDLDGDAASVTSRDSHVRHYNRWYHRLFFCVSKLWKVASDLLSRFSDLLWRIVEVHFIKAVFFTIFMCAVMEVSAINVVFMVFLLVGIPIPQLHKAVSHACLVWCGLVILVKMVFQLQTIQDAPNVFNSTCIKSNTSNATPLEIPSDNAKYLGLQQAPNLAYYIRNYIAILVVLAFEGIIWIRQAQHYNKPNVVKPKQGIIFPEIKRADADANLLKFFKFFANYCFYKFGLELCFIMTVITMVVRLDAYSLVYGFLLGFLLCLSRRACFICWPIYIIVLAVLLAAQYLAVLGAPPILCWEYPWSTYIRDSLKVFLYLPSYEHSPDAIKLIADFFQLGFVCMQWRVFFLENSNDVEEYGGGDNKDILEDVEAGTENPVEDFLSCKDSYLDYLKTGVFMYLFWMTLVLVFIAGTTRISLFCMGYLMGVFFFLWFGQEMLIKPLRKLLRLWGILLGYNYFVLMCKCALQLVGCVYIDVISNQCWLVQLLSIVCIQAEQYREKLIPKCSMKEDQAGLIWDSFCFVFLLFQLRIYRSHYFRHVVTELNVQQKLSARGAELINENLMKSVEERKEAEKQVLLKIKQKMERLKMRQERLAEKRPLFNSDDHYVVIRSGDYYMFDDDSDDDTASSLEPDTLTLGVNEKDDTDSKRGPLALINTALSGGPQEAMKMVKRRSRTDSTNDSWGRQHSFSDPSDMSPSERRARMQRSGAMRDSIREEGQDAAPLITTPEDDYGSAASTSPGTSKAAVPVTEQPSPSDKTDPAKDGIAEDDSGSDVADLEEDVQPDGLWQRIVTSIKLSWAVVISILDYVIESLNNWSREYRDMARVLEKEKEQEKQRIKEEGADSLKKPESRDSLRRERAADPRDLTLQLATTTSDALDGPAEEVQDPEKEFRDSTPRIFQLFIALFDVMISHSDLLCYFAMILNHLVSASLLSLVYPILVFLWALLSVPRPSKTFWVTMITYTEAVVVVKYLFQFGFFPWNVEVSASSAADPFYPPRIIGIERKDYYAAYDLFLLVCLFIHRSVLKRNGLWKDSGDDEEDVHQGDAVNGGATSPVNTPTMGSPGPTIKSSEEGSRRGAYGQENQAMEQVSPTEEVAGGALSEEEVEERHRHKKQPGWCFSCCFPFIRFFRQMTDPLFNAATDVYAVMFLCDFINFFIIVFGYKSFGPTSGGAESGATVVAAVIQENKVPIPFLVMLLVQFVLMIIDRAIYLRKRVVGKFIYQIFLVALIHVWMFFILPAITHRSFSQNVPAQLWYFVKCIYFGLSAYQIRSGYPTRILGNFLTKRFDYTNLFLFKGFLAIPFLLELRALMDWIWTDTTLALTSWLEMEDIYANIFQLKCWRKAEDAYPTQRGQLRKLAIKYGVGGLLLFLLIFIIWFPLLLFSLADTVLYVPNPPVDCTVQIKIGGYQPIFHMSAQQNFLKPMNEYNYSRLLNMYSDKPEALSVLEQYKASDITIVQINGESTALWGISPPSKDALFHDLINKNTNLKIYFSISFKRDPKPGLNTDTVTAQFPHPLNPSNKTREEFALMINGNRTKPVNVVGLFPRFMRVPPSEAPQELLALTKGVKTDVTFNLNGTDQQWWELHEQASEKYLESSASFVEHDSLTIFAFNDRVAPAGLSFFTGYGIIGLYVSLVFVIGQFVRLFFSGLSSQIMFQELPNVDKVLKLCLDIYMVREALELKMEEELFAKLQFLYRSPQMLIQLTKHKVS